MEIQLLEIQLLPGTNVKKLNILECGKLDNIFIYFFLLEDSRKEHRQTHIHVQNNNSKSPSKANTIETGTRMKSVSKSKSCEIAIVWRLDPIHTEYDLLYRKRQEKEGIGFELGIIIPAALVVLL